jgi:hypothetical protein
LQDATDQGFILSLEKDATREFTFDEVKSFRKLGMKGWAKALIIGGAIVGGILITTAVLAAGGCCV